MRKRFFVFAGVAMYSVLAGTPVQAIDLFEHIGNTDPETEGFSVFYAGHNVSGGTENGTDYWEVNTPDGANGGYFQVPSNADVFSAGGWRLTWRVKVIDAIRPMEAQMDLQEPLNEFQFGLVSTLGPYGLDKGAYYRAHASFDWIKISSVDPSSDYMTWQMQLDAKGNGNPNDDEVKFYLNGSLLATAPRSEIIPSGGGNFGAWGDLNGSVEGTTRTSLFRFEVLRAAGDYNGNGSVDAADYVVWRDTLDQMGKGLAADGDGSGTIDAGDYDFWKKHFGEPGGSASAGALPSQSAVPEPNGLLLVGVIGVLAGRFSRFAKRRG